MTPSRTTQGGKCSTNLLCSNVCYHKKLILGQVPFTIANKFCEGIKGMTTTNPTRKILTTIKIAKSLNIIFLNGYSI
jgi:hypothetical protein